MLRKAVGAIVKCNNKYLLVNKNKCVSTGEKLVDHWDFPKGALELFDKSEEEAIIRELMEETGSRHYKIVNKFESKISFDFPKNHKFDRQETTIFLIEFYGAIEELIPDGQEIGKIEFFEREPFLEKIKLKETQLFLAQNEW